MKLHLPSGLRKALMACLTAMSVALPPTLGSASGIAAVFTAAMVMAPQQAAAKTLTWTNQKEQWEKTGSVWEQGPPDQESDDGWKNIEHFMEGDSAIFGETGTEGAQSGGVLLKGTINAQNVDIAVGEWTWKREAEDPGDPTVQFDRLQIQGTLTVKTGATLTLATGGPGEVALQNVVVQDNAKLRLKVGDAGANDPKISVGGTKTLNGTLEIELRDNVGKFPGGKDLWDVVNLYVNGATKGANSELKLTNGEYTVDEGKGTVDPERRVNFRDVTRESGMLRGLGCLTIGEGIELYYGEGTGDTLSSGDTVKKLKLEGGRIFVENGDATIGGSIEVAENDDVSTLDVRQPYAVTLSGDLNVDGYMKVRGGGGFVVKGGVTVNEGKTLRFVLHDGRAVQTEGVGNAYLRGAVNLRGDMAVEEGCIVELNGALTMTDGSDMTLTNEGVGKEDEEKGIKSKVIFGNGFSVAEGSIGKVTVGAGTELRNAQLAGAGSIDMQQIEVTVDGKVRDDAGEVHPGGTLDVGVNGMTVNMFSGGEGGVVESTDDTGGAGGGTLTLQDGRGGTFGGRVGSNLTYNPVVGEGEKGKYTINEFVGNALHVEGGELTVNIVTGALPEANDEGGMVVPLDKWREHTVQVENGQTLHVRELGGYVWSVTVGDDGELSKIPGGGEVSNAELENPEKPEKFEVFTEVTNTGELGGHIGTLTMGARSTLDIAELSASIAYHLQVDGGTKNEETGEVTYSTFKVGTLSSASIPILTMGNYVKSDVGKLTGHVEEWTVGSDSALNVGKLTGHVEEWTVGSDSALNVGTWSGTVGSLALGTGTVAAVKKLDNATIGTLTLNGSRLELGNGTLNLSKLTVGAGGGTISIQMAGAAQGTIFADSLFNHVNREGDAKVELEVEVEDIYGLADYKYHLFGDSDEDRLKPTDEETGEVTWFNEHFTLSYVFDEGEDEEKRSYSENDKHRWDAKLDAKGWLTFTAKAMDLTWTATGSGEGKEALTWKVDGTAAESGWDNYEIFRKGDKVRFTAGDDLLNDVTLEQAITAEAVLVESGVFNFKAKDGVTDATLTVTDSMTVESGATAQVECSLTVQGNLEMGDGATATVGTLRGDAADGTWTVGSDSTLDVGTWSGTVGSLALGTGTVAAVKELSATIGTLTMEGGDAEKDGGFEFDVTTLSGRIDTLTMEGKVDARVGTMEGEIEGWTMKGENSTLTVTELGGAIGTLTMGSGSELTIEDRSSATITELTMGANSTFTVEGLSATIGTLTMKGGDAEKDGGLEFDVTTLSGGITKLTMENKVDARVGGVAYGGWIGEWTMGTDSSLTMTQLEGGLNSLSMGEHSKFTATTLEGTGIIGTLTMGNSSELTIEDRSSATITELTMGENSTFTVVKEGEELGNLGGEIKGALTMGANSTFTVEELSATIGTLDLGAGTIATVTNLSGSIEKTQIKDGTILTVEKNLSGSLGHLTLGNGSRLNLNKGKLDVQRLTVEGEEAVIHIRMDDIAGPTTFADGVLASDPGGKVKLEVELDDVLKLGEDGSGNRRYQLFGEGGLLDEHKVRFNEKFELSYEFNENGDYYSWNDRFRWKAEFSLEDGRGWLTFGESGAKLGVTWTIDKTEENTLTWKNGGTRAESGWDRGYNKDGGEIFRQGDEVTFTVADAVAEPTGEGDVVDPGPYTVTLEGPIEAGAMTVSKGVFNFVLPQPQGEAPAAEAEGVADLTVTGDLTVNEGATANVGCSLEVRGVTSLAGTTLTLGGGATLGDLVGSGGTLRVSGGEVTLGGVGIVTPGETPEGEPTETVEKFTGTLAVEGGGTLTLGNRLAAELGSGEVTLELNGGTIVLAAGENELVPTVTPPVEEGGEATTENHVVKVGGSGGTLRVGEGMGDSLTATLEGVGMLTLDGGTFNLKGETKGEVKLGANTGLVGDALAVVGVSGEADTAELGGTVTLTGAEDATYTYGGGLQGGLRLTVVGGTHDYTMDGQEMASLTISGGSLTWHNNEVVTELNITAGNLVLGSEGTAKKLSITGGGLTWEGNLTTSNLTGTVNLGREDKSNTLILTDHPDEGGETGGTYTGKLTLGILDVRGTGTHTVKDGDIGALKVEQGATLKTDGGTLSVGSVVSAEGTVVLNGSTLGLVAGANTLGTLGVVGAENNLLQLGGGELATKLVGSGELSVAMVGKEGAAALALRGATGEGVTVELGANTELTGEGATLERVTGVGTIEATGLSLVGTEASEAGFSGIIASGASVILQGGGNWTLGNGARIDGELKTQGALTLEGKVTLNHQMTIVGETGSLTGTGTLDIQMSNTAAAAAGGAIALEGTVGTGAIGEGIHITFGGEVAVGSNARWTYQLFGSLSGLGDGLNDFVDRIVGKDGVSGILGRPSEERTDFRYHLDGDGKLSILVDEEGEQHWLEGEDTFTWTDASGTDYNKWTVDTDPPTRNQQFSPYQDVEFAGTFAGTIEHPITVTVDGRIEIGGHNMRVNKGENGVETQSYKFLVEGETAALIAGNLVIGAGVTAEFEVKDKAEVTVDATTVKGAGALVLSGDGTRAFGDVTVEEGASVSVKGWGNLSGQVHGDGTLYFDCGTADTSIVSGTADLANVEVVAGTTLDIVAGSEAQLGHIGNLKVNDRASLTVSDASAVAGEKNPSVHIGGTGVGGNGALVVKENLGEVRMTGWSITLDGETSIRVGAGSELKYDGVMELGEGLWLTKVGGGVLEFTGETAVENFRVTEGTLRLGGDGKNTVAVGTVALTSGTTLESAITGTLGTLSGSGTLRVSGGELTVTNMTQGLLDAVGFSGGGKLHVGVQAVTGNTLELGAGGGTLYVEMTENGDNLTFGTLTQVDGGKLTLHLTGFGDVFPTADTEGTYQLFRAPEFKVLWDKLVAGNPEATWRDYFDLEVEGTNRLDVELGTSEGKYGQLSFTMDAGIVWQGGGDRMWGSGADWVGGVAPGVNDNVTFDGAGQGDVTLDGDVRAKDVWVESGSYTFTGKADAPEEEVKDTLTLTVGDLVVQGGAGLNLNVELRGHSDGTGMSVVLRGDETKGVGTLNVQGQGALGTNVNLQFAGGQLVFDKTSNPGDLSGKVSADRSTSGVKVKVVGADAKGNAWGREAAQQGDAPSGGVALALEKGIEKSGDGVFTLYWKEKGSGEAHAAAMDVVGGTLALDVSGDTVLSGAVSLGGELDVKSTTAAVLTGAVTGAGTLKATGGQVNLTGDTAGFSGTVAADNGAVLTLSGAAVPVAEGKGTVNLKMSGNGGTVAIDGGEAEMTLRSQVSGSGAGVTLRNAGSGGLVVVGNAAGNGSGAKLDGGTGGIVLGTAAERATWAGSEVTGGDITLRNVVLQGGLKAKGGKAHIYVDTTPVNPNGAAAAAAAVADGGVVDMGGTDVGLLDGITVNREGEVRGLGGGTTYNVGVNKKLTLYFTAESWGKSEAEKGGMRAPIQGSGFDIELAGGNATEGGLQMAFDYDIVKWFRTEDTLYLHALDGGTWNANGTVLDWANMEDSVAQMLDVVVGQNYTFTGDGLLLRGIARDLYVVMDGAESDAAESNAPKDLAWDAENQEGRRSTVVLDGKTLTLKWDGSTAAAGTPDGLVPNLLGSAGTHLQIQNTAASGRTGVNRLEVALDNSDQGGIRDGRFEGADGSTHFPEADGTKVQGVDTTFLGSITGDIGVDLTKTGKGTLTVGGDYSLVEGTTKITEGALVLRGAANTLKDIEFAYTTAQDTKNKEARRGLELSGGKTTVTGMIRESNGEGLSGDIRVTKGAGLVLKDNENTLVGTGISGDNTGVLELEGKAGLTLEGDGTKRQLGGVAVKLGAGATLDTGKDKSDLTALSGSGRLESTEGGVVTLRGENTFSGTLAASGEGVNAGKLKLADGAKFTFANTKSTATGTANAWDVELGKNVTLTLDVSGKSGKAADCLTLGDVSMGDSSVTVEFGGKAIGEHYLAANLTNVGKGGTLTFHSDGMVKGDMKVDSGLTVLDAAARETFGEHVHFTGVASFLTEQNVTVDETGKVWFEYKENADNKLLDSEHGIPGAGKNGQAGANMLWDSLEGKSQSQEFLDALMNQQGQGSGGYYGLVKELVQRLDTGNSGDMERVLSSVAGASIATLGPALAEDVHRQLKSIRNRATSLVNDGEEEVGTSLIRHAWINGETGYYELDADGYLPGFTLKNWGGTVGVDMNVGKKTVVALALSAMYGDLEPDAAEVSDGSLDTTWLSGVVQTTRGRWTHTVVVSVGMADAEINRTVNYGSGSYHTSGSTDGYAYGALYEVGYTHLLDKQGRTALQPVANIEWRHVTLDSYTEQGGDGAGLNVDEISQDVVTIGAGARLQTMLGANWVNHATLLETRALVKADIGDRSGTAENAIVGMSGKGRSEVESAEIGAVGVEVGAGVTVPLGPRAGSVFADASLEWRSGWTALDATVGYKINF